MTRPVGLGEVADAKRRHFGKAELKGGGDAAVAGHDLVRLVDEHRVGEAEARNRAGDRRDLLLGMGAGVARIGLERSRREHLDGGMVHHLAGQR